MPNGRIFRFHEAEDEAEGRTSPCRPVLAHLYGETVRPCRNRHEPGFEACAGRFHPIDCPPESRSGIAVVRQADGFALSCIPPLRRMGKDRPGSSPGRAQAGAFIQVPWAVGQRPTGACRPHGCAFRTVLADRPPDPITTATDRPLAWSGRPAPPRGPRPRILIWAGALHTGIAVGRAPAHMLRGREESGCPQSLQRVSGCQGWRTTGSEASAFRVSWSRNSLRTMASETNWSNHSADAT